MKRILLVIMSVFALFVVSEAQANSNFYKVINVSSGDHLNMREGPSFRTAAISNLPYNATGIRVLLWAKKKTGKHYWVKVAWNERFGWVNSYYLSATKKSSPVKRVIYRCAGTEPFWDARVYKKRVKVSILDGAKFNARIRFKGRPMNSPVGTTIINAHSGRQSVMLMTEKAYCSDGMSDEQYSYKVIMLVNGNRAYSGCCN